MTVHPLTQQLLELLDSDRRPMYKIAELAGIDISSFSAWRKGDNMPRIVIMEAVLEVLGYELAVVK